jgi:hypothetical protein
MQAAIGAFFDKHLKARPDGKAKDPPQGKSVRKG